MKESTDTLPVGSDCQIKLQLTGSLKQERQGMSLK